MLVMVQGWAKPDPFDWRKVKPYLVYVSLLLSPILGLRESVIVTTIYSNFKALELSNAETLIVARSCVPCVVAFGPYLIWAEALHEHALNIPDGSDWPCV